MTDRPLSPSLTTFMLLGELMREAERPAKPELRLGEKGWEIHGGEWDHHVLTVTQAWVIAESHEPGMGADVVAKSRELCGDLRIRAKARSTSRAKAAEFTETVAALRAGLAEIREARHGEG